MSTILIDARELRTTSGRYVERLLNYLQKADKYNDYKVLLKPEDLDGWHTSNPRFEKIPCPHKEFTFAEQISLLRQIRNFNPDLVHFPFPQQPILYTGKTVTTIHDLTTLRFYNPDKNWLIFKLKQLVYRYVIMRAARKSAAILTGTEFVAEDVAQFARISPAKITVTPEAADPIKDAADPIKALEGEKFIMYIGRPTPHKNLERLIDAYAKLRAQHPQLKLVLAGKKDNNYMRIESEVRHRAIKGVVFTDRVSEGRLKWLYENCSAYVFPSLSEGFGLPGLEAMLHGAPVVSSNATCLPEVYGDAAHYFDPTDVQAMSDAINEVLTDKKLRKDLIARGKKQTAQYSWERMATQTLEVYNQALRK